MSDQSPVRVPIFKRVERTVLTVLGVSATLLMFGNAVGRYLFGSSLVWAEEVIRMLFVAAMFIAITTAFLRNQHIGFDAFAKKPGFLNVLYRIVNSLCLLTVGGILAVYGYIYNDLTGSVQLSGTNWPTALFMWPGILAGAVWFLIGAFRLVELVLGKPERTFS